MTAPQEELLDYLRKHPETTKKAITPTDDGAEIDCAVLSEVFDRLGYDGKKEVKKIDFAFSEKLEQMYKLSDNFALVN